MFRTHTAKDPSGRLRGDLPDTTLKHGDWWPSKSRQRCKGQLHHQTTCVSRSRWASPKARNRLQHGGRKSQQRRMQGTSRSTSAVYAATSGRGNMLSTLLHHMELHRPQAVHQRSAGLSADEQHVEDILLDHGTSFAVGASLPLTFGRIRITKLQILLAGMTYLDPRTERETDLQNRRRSLPGGMMRGRPGQWQMAVHSPRVPNLLTISDCA